MQQYPSTPRPGNQDQLMSRSKIEVYVCYSKIERERVCVYWKTREGFWVLNHSECNLSNSHIKIVSRLCLDCIHNISDCIQNLKHFVISRYSFETVLDTSPAMRDNSNERPLFYLKSNTCISEVLQICPTSLLHQHLLVILMQFWFLPLLNYGQLGFHCCKRLKGSKISATAICWTENKWQLYSITNSHGTIYC